jgi:hypothetical protein
LARLGNVNSPHSVGTIRSGEQLLLDLPQESLLAVLPYLVDADAIHTRRPAVGLHSSPGFLQDIETTNLIVQ